MIIMPCCKRKKVHSIVIMQCFRCLQDSASFHRLLSIMCKLHERKHCPRRIDKLPLSLSFFFLSTLKISFHAFSFSLQSKFHMQFMHIHMSVWAFFVVNMCIKCCSFHSVANETLLVHFFHPDAFEVLAIRVPLF